VDQGISVNTSYNPVFFPEEKIPMSVMLQHLVMFYKYGGKQLYYNNTLDGQGEIEFKEETPKLDSESDTLDDDCDSCKI
jgi:ribonucleoside-diphosphate reductase alpha chain